MSSRTYNITIDLLIRDLLKWLKKKKEHLKLLNKQITKDTQYWIDNDFDYVISYLSSYRLDENRSSNHLIKPKGNVYIILSYNEPFVLGVIPVINALIAGNNVVVRPSTLSIDFLKYIWQASGLIKKHRLKLKISSSRHRKNVEKHIKNSQSVYFFGGFENAKKVAQLCSKHFVEFNPEIETSDFKIVNYQSTLDKLEITRDVSITIPDFLSHAGQSCQRIQGVYVNDTNYQLYCDLLESEILNMCKSGKIEKHISKDYSINKKYLDSIYKKIYESEPNKVVKGDTEHKFPILVFNPISQSSFVNGAFFIPSLWVISYSSYKELYEAINKRFYRMGINIKSNDKAFIDKIVNNTNYSRYTVNRKHTELLPNEGWGGVWPSGYRGYRNWIDIFSNPSVIIK